MCTMRYNPMVPTSYPYGRFYLYQKNPWSDVIINGYMKQMPKPASKHGFAINEKPWKYRTKDCSSAGRHWNPTNETNGEMNNMTYPSHVGNLKNISDNAAGNTWYSAKA
jgi:Cu/Zn superoxide dismutase